MNKTEYLPCLPLRDIVVFPGMIVPLFVGRDKSIKSLNHLNPINALDAAKAPGHQNDSSVPDVPIVSGHPSSANRNTANNETIQIPPMHQMPQIHQDLSMFSITQLLLMLHDL